MPADAKCTNEHCEWHPTPAWDMSPRAVIQRLSQLLAALAELWGGLRVDHEGLLQLRAEIHWCRCPEVD